MKKWKLAPLYKGKFVNKHRVEVEPFPGVSLLRWTIYNPINGVTKYEGKPSYQAMEVVTRYYRKNRKKLLLCEFDRGGPIIVLTFYGENFEVQDANWNLWTKYHGDVPFDKTIQVYRRNRNDGVPKNAKVG